MEAVVSGWTVEQSTNVFLSMIVDEDVIAVNVSVRILSLES
jgi:hypothetical protein